VRCWVTDSSNIVSDYTAVCGLQITKIVRSIPAQRQTLFFSASWPREVKAIASQFVTNRTVHVFLGGVEEKLVANKAITQVPSAQHLVAQLHWVRGYTR